MGHFYQKGTTITQKKQSRRLENYRMSVESTQGTLDSREQLCQVCVSGIIPQRYKEGCVCVCVLGVIIWLFSGGPKKTPNLLL